MSVVAVVDCETTGLDPDRHELLELAILRHEPDDVEPVEPWCGAA